MGASRRYRLVLSAHKASPMPRSTTEGSCVCGDMAYDRDLNNGEGGYRQKCRSPAFCKFCGEYTMFLVKGVCALTTKTLPGLCVTCVERTAAAYERLELPHFRDPDGERADALQPPPQVGYAPPARNDVAQPRVAAFRARGRVHGFVSSHKHMNSCSGVQVFSRSTVPAR